MKILFLADNFPPERNAQASRVYERACYWAKWGHDVTVITCAPNFPEGKLYRGYRNRWYQTEEMSGIRVVRVKTFIAANAGTVLRVIDFLSFMITASCAALLERRPSVLIATSPQFFAAVAGCFVSLVRRVPFIFELSDLWPDSIVAVGAMKKGLALRWLEKLELLLYRRAAAVVALTAAFKQNLVRRGIPAQKVAVVINGVDLARYQPRGKDTALASEWGIASDEFVIGYIGTHGMAHALVNVLHSAERTQAARIRYLFVGTGAERERLVKQATELGLKNVTFVPPQPKERMPAFWSLCDVALIHLKDSPAFEAVIPSKIFEAMGMGLPLLIASPPGEAAQIVLTQEAGIWVRAEDPGLLAAAAMRLDGDRELVARLARNSLAAAPRFTRERQARDMLTVLDNVASGRSKITLDASRVSAG